jgi:hypothetical protein
MSDSIFLHFSRSDVIDLTEEPQHRTEGVRTPEAQGFESASVSHRCPICQEVFPDSTIESHASECLAAAKEGGVSSSDDDDDMIPSRRVRLARSRKAGGAGPGRQETNRQSHLMALDVFADYAGNGKH